jgi:TolB-like protein/tetratricopeptide (TPR) repeat protein
MDVKGFVDRDIPSIREQLERILASREFRHTRRRRELLKWSVERALRDSEPPKEFEIATEVYGKPDTWDPRIDPVVRVEFGRLRKDLASYYETEGAQDPVLIEFPVRGYAPSFSIATLSNPAPAPAAAPAPPVPEPGHRRPYILVAACSVVVLGLVAWAIGRPAPAKPPVTALAVLPFRDFTQDQASTHLGDGLTDEITNELVRLPGLRVAARTSAFQFRDRNVDVREIGRLLGVGSVLEGSIQRFGARTRVVVQLNRTSDGTHIWAETIDDDRVDLMKVQRDVARAVADVLRLRIAAADSVARSGFELSREAQDAYLNGLGQMDQLTPQSLAEAVSLLSRVIAAQPRFPQAWKARALTHMNRAGSGSVDPLPEYNEARTDILHALELDPHIANGQAMLASIEYVANWDWPHAEQHFVQAIRTADTAYARNAYGLSLMSRGRVAESEENFRKALELDPLSAYERMVFSSALSLVGRYQTALAELTTARHMQPEWFLLPLSDAATHYWAGQPRVALDELKETERLGGPLAAQAPDVQAVYAACYLDLGRRDEAKAIIAKLEADQNVPGHRIFNYYLALLHSLLGDADGMFRYLEKSADLREYPIVNIKVDSRLAHWQGDQRMAALRKRVGLD